MPVEFLTDDEAAAYGLYTGAPSQADLDRVFFLDDDDLELAGRHRGEHMRAGLASPLRAHPAPPASFRSPAYGLNCAAQRCASASSIT